MSNPLNAHQIVALLSPVAKTATFTSNLVDRAGSVGSLGLLVHIGADTGTLDGSNYLTLTYEESDSTANSSFTAVAAADMLLSCPVLNSKATYENTIRRSEYRGTKRYFRVVVTETGTVNCILGLTAIQEMAHQPVTATVAGTAAT
jgi:hypothetical protein